MKKRKLKGFVLPTLYMLITVCIFTSIIFLGSSINLKNKNYDYGINALKENVESVIVEDTVTTSSISSPVDTDKATIEIHFYNKEDEEQEQQQSLIYYENTYLPNTGVIYTSNETFEVKNVFDGKVTDILEDEFFGKYVVVEHTKNVRTYYYGIDEIEVSVGDEISSGELIGMSKVNSIINNKNSFLLEVYHNNKLVDPEEFIGSKITDFE